MFDRSLGDTVTVGKYTGFFVDGRPLHDGSCTDDVYGCRKCNCALATLPDEQRKLVTHSRGPDALPLNEAEFRLAFTFTCEWCSRKRERLANRGVTDDALPDAVYDVSELCYHSCADEGGSVVYELCDDCDSNCGCREQDDEDYDTGDDRSSLDCDPSDSTDDDDCDGEECDNGTYFRKD